MKTERYINIYNRYIDMGRLGSFEIGQRLEIFIFRGVGWGDRVGVWGQISGMFILWGGSSETEIRDVYIFGGVVPCGGFGVRHITSGMLIGEGPCGGGVTGRGVGFGDSYGGCLYH